MEETGQPTAFDEDPAAAFMAREQEDLAGIADDTLGSGLMVKCYFKKYNSLLCGLGVAVCKLSFPLASRAHQWLHPQEKACWTVEVISLEQLW